MTMIGIDPHQATHTAVAIDDNEAVLDEFTPRASAAQAQRPRDGAAESPRRGGRRAGGRGLGRLDGRGLGQIGEDRPVGMGMVRAGVMALEEAEQSFAWHRLTRAAGLDARLEVDVFPVDAAGADAFLLCSDGLTGMVADDEIARLMRAALPDPRAVGEALIDAALAAGGDDNVTVGVCCPPSTSN